MAVALVECAHIKVREKWQHFFSLYILLAVVFGDLDKGMRESMQTLLLRRGGVLVVRLTGFFAASNVASIAAIWLARSYTHARTNKQSEQELLDTKNGCTHDTIPFQTVQPQFSLALPFCAFVTN